LQATPLARESEANVREYYEAHTRELAEGGGFIFAEDVPLYESKPENLQAAMETIREQGTY